MSETITYFGMHARLARELGPAAIRACVDCSRPAQNWAYNHQDPDQMTDASGLVYGSSADYYQPMCIPCHRKLDAAQRPCGTDAGYYRHRRAGEPACADCKRGHREATYARAVHEYEDGAR